MVDDEIFALSFEVLPESLWKAVKQVLSSGIGATLKQVDEEERRAIFTTETSTSNISERFLSKRSTRRSVRRRIDFGKGSSL